MNRIEWNGKPADHINQMAEHWGNSGNGHHCESCERSDGLHDYHEQSSPENEITRLRKALADILGCSSLRKAWGVAEEALKDA